MKLILDGEEYLCDVCDVKIIWESQTINHRGKEVDGELHLTATPEGIIADFFEGNDNESLITQSMDIQDIANLLK